jgi:Zn-dependent peptidase ImmA (M78 family)
MADRELAARLKRARETVGLSIKDASSRLGFPSYQTLSKIEAGEREVKASELSLFCKAYFCSTASLLRSGKVSAGKLLWRKAPPAEARKRLETLILTLCEHYSFAESLLNEEATREFRFCEDRKESIRTNDDIDVLANDTRASLGLGKRPAFSLNRILEQNYGVKVLYCALSDQASAASMVHEHHGPVAVINSDEAPWRRNYDLAHELFHLITGRLFSDEDLKNRVLFDEVEKKAERFASTLLLPEEEVVRELNARIKSQVSLMYSDLVDVARDFGVSTVALLYRLANLRKLSWEKADELAKDENLVALDRQTRRGEWGDAPVSERFWALTVRCLRKGLISRGKFAEMLSIDRSDIDMTLEKFGYTGSEGPAVEVIPS